MSLDSPIILFSLSEFSQLQSSICQAAHYYKIDMIFVWLGGFVVSVAMSIAMASILDAMGLELLLIFILRRLGY